MVETWKFTLTLGPLLYMYCIFGTFRAQGKWVRTGFHYKICPQARLWPPHFLQWEGSVIRHSSPGSGTIAASRPWLLTPSHGLLIRLTFRDMQELRAVIDTQRFGPLPSHHWRLKERTLRARACILHGNVLSSLYFQGCYIFQCFFNHFHITLLDSSWGES